MSKYDGWTPTPENIKALPEPVRRYIHDIEANCDPAGIVAENTLVRDQNAQLVAEVMRLKGVLLKNTK